MSFESSNIIYITENEENIRIDKLLSDRYKDKSRTYFQYLIENKAILINGKEIKKKELSKIGDKIEISFLKTKEISVDPENIKLDILFEDEDIIAINKPPFMVVHPAPGNWDGTFVNALLFHCNNILREEDDLRPGIVHRIDKETSGVLLAAKTIEAHRKLINQFASREIKKQYLAITINNPKDQLVSAPIGRNKAKRKEMEVNEHGKEAVTEIITLASKNNLSLVLAKPRTGRTHQIRVHLKHLNCPILGDDTYGKIKINKQFNTPRVLLHAFKINFSHPIKNIPIEIKAPIPSDFKKYFHHFDPINFNF